MAAKEIPIKILYALGKDLELYTEKVVIRGNNWFSRLLSQAQIIPLNQIAEVKIVDDPVVQVGRFTIILTDGKPIILRFAHNYDREARDIQSMIAARISDKDIAHLAKAG